VLHFDDQKFQNEFYQGPDGGRKAAWKLQTCVKDYLEKSEPGLACLPIVIKAFANGEGLSKFLANAVGTKHSSSLADFTMGFSQSQALSDFVLVGNGKDRADKKIKGEMTLPVLQPARSLLSRCFRAVCTEPYMSPRHLWGMP
jgi:hypothetical protein